MYFTDIRNSYWKLKQPSLLQQVQEGFRSRHLSLYRHRPTHTYTHTQTHAHKHTHTSYNNITIPSIRPHTHAWISLVWSYGSIFWNTQHNLSLFSNPCQQQMENSFEFSVSTDAFLSQKLGIISTHGWINYVSSQWASQDKQKQYKLKTESHLVWNSL